MTEADGATSTEPDAHGALGYVSGIVPRARAVRENCVPVLANDAIATTSFEDGAGSGAPRPAWRRLPSPHTPVWARIVLWQLRRMRHERARPFNLAVHAVRCMQCGACSARPALQARTCSPSTSASDARP